MPALETITGVITVLQAIAGTWKAIGKASSAIKDSHKTLKYWNVTSKKLHMISKNFEYALQQRASISPIKEAHEDSHYEVIRDILDLFNSDLQELQRSIKSANATSQSSSKRPSFRNKAKLAFKMDWEQNEKLLQRAKFYITLLSFDKDLINGLNHGNTIEMQRALETGQARVKALSGTEPLVGNRFELKDCFRSAEVLIRQRGLRNFVSTDEITLAAEEPEYDVIEHTPIESITVKSTTTEEISIAERTYRLDIKEQYVKHLEDSNYTAIAAIDQLEVIRLWDELNQARGIVPTFEGRFQLQERYLHLLIASIEIHPIYGTRAKEYLGEHVIPKLDMTNPDLRNVWLSVGRMYFRMRIRDLAEQYLRPALDRGYLPRHNEGCDTEIEEISKMLCRIYEGKGAPENAMALRKIVKDKIGRDPLVIPGDPRHAVEWCRKKGFDDVETKGDQLVFHSQKNDKGRTALHEAALEKGLDNSILPKLMIDDLLTLTDDSGDTALLLAIAKSNISVIKSLLQTPTLLQVRDHNGWTPLHRCNDSQTLSLILNAMKQSPHRSSMSQVGLDTHSPAALVGIDTKDPCGRTALLMACQQGDLKMMKKLLDAGADTRESDNKGVCPILACASSTLDISSTKRKEMILRLLARNADPDQPDNDGNTARTELPGTFHSAKKADQLLAQDPSKALEEIERLSRADRRDSGSTSTTTRSSLSIFRPLSWVSRSSTSPSD
ncbi:hypothetical protein F53441_8396 [Fusarium austroafricanum]|uniref:Fungal N-terminal domain-containing protein n=1 Tax=Fusarium austroafricanum TaxID=2364996 RepID=A0A8H4KDQ2_9HYPO|nr:hypothetical protein F53441_8396 [Fusarium austroafricanum]